MAPLSLTYFWPPPPAPASNEIGQYEIGVSPIGTIPRFNWLATVISQYANSQTLLGLISSLAAALLVDEMFDQFYDMIWNVATAQGYGLDVWGRIVGVTRQLHVANAPYFGFVEGNVGKDYDVFGPGGTSPFYGGQPTTSNFTLTDQVFRQLIMAKAAFNICNGSIPAINAILMNLFGGPGLICYVKDDGNMEMEYVFEFQPSAVQLAIINQSGVLPRPTGVAATVTIL